MKEAGFDFVVRVEPINEFIPSQITANEAALYLARLKSQALEQNSENEIILTADTVVIQEDRVLGKPGNRQEAIDMLEHLSGSTHEVITGVYIRHGNYKKGFSVKTRVDFAILERPEIEYYVDTYAPFDKAGAYGIQEWIGQVGIRKIDGSYYNVVGLPVHEIYEELKRFA